eukprot:Skav235182  [mRNA]  locus=scaffold721:328593:330236:+ [translate_table: standard]
MPHGDTGGLLVCFALVPPPWGWVCGSCALPRTDGRQPSQRLMPALPLKRMARSRWESCPMEAQHSNGNLRISVDRSLMVACKRSFVTMVAKVPAARIN